jgi:hypothetical protein
VLSTFAESAEGDADEDSPGLGGAAAMIRKQGKQVGVEREGKASREERGLQKTKMRDGSGDGSGGVSGGESFKVQSLAGLGVRVNTVVDRWRREQTDGSFESRYESFHVFVLENQFLIAGYNLWKNLDSFNCSLHKSYSNKSYL